MTHYTVENTVGLGQRPIIYCDGNRLNDVVECHTEENWAIVCMRNQHGEFFLDGDEIATMKVVGDIYVVFSDPISDILISENG